LRAALVRLHRYAGLAMAGVLVIAGLSGSVLAFQGELDAWLNPELFQARHTTPAAAAPSQIAVWVSAADPRARATVVMMPMMPGTSASAFVAARSGAGPLEYSQVFVDPGTGEVLGRRKYGALRWDRAHLIPFLYILHQSLQMPGVWGMWLMGGIGIAWMVDCVVGFVLTLPRGRPFWMKWRPAWGIKKNAGSYRLNFDLHRASGLWLWGVLFTLALTGMSINLNREVFRPVLTALLPTTPSLLLDEPIPASAPPITIDFDTALAYAQGEAARRGWNKPVYFIHAIDRTGFYRVRYGRPHHAGYGLSTIYVAGDDGRILSVEEAGAGKAGDVVAALMFPLHTGQVAGLPGRILVCLSGIAVAVLSVTGVVVWWKKRAGRRARSGT
jgi:uncharacterized iron-regulated membrane protein